MVSFFLFFTIINNIFCNNYYSNIKETIIENQQIFLNYFHKYINNCTLEIPSQYIEIIEFSDNMVVIMASSILGANHCFYKAIEFFYSKYTKFHLKMITPIYEDDQKIIIKFVAYNIIE